MEYDVIHIDDDPYIKEIIQNAIKGSGLSYLSAATLDELEQLLKEHWAKIWIVDGKFPKESGGRVEFNAKNAVKLIRSVRNDAKIILYSAEHNVDVKAAELGVGHVLKGGVNSDIIAEINKLLETQD